MSSTAPRQAIYRRWRAQTFGQIVGQQAVVETLRNGVRSGRTFHAYLFVGPRGTGKTSLARILAKALNCSDLRDGEPCDACPSCVAIREGRALDVSEMDAASNNRVDDMRELLPRIFTAPSDLRCKVFIIDEVQRIKEGWDVLLKTLEEPPDHVVFIFCTTDSNGIRPAVLSRVQRFDFRRMTVPEISGKLRTILEGDGRTAEPEAIELIARLAAGGMRDAESMLDQLLATDTGALTADRVREVLGLVDEETVEAFLGALVRCDAVAGIELLEGMEELGRDLGAFAEQAIERLRVALVASLGRGDPVGLAAAGPEALGAAARRLASIDPRHPGPGGLRLQLELLLLAPPEARPHSRLESPVSIDRTAAAPQPAASLPPVAADRPARSEHPTARPGAGRKAPEAELVSSAPAAPANPEAEPVAPAARQAPRPRTGPTLALLLERWAEVVELVSKSPPTRPLIVACRPVSVDGSVVTLGFPEAQSFFKDVAERRRAILEDGVSRVLGIPVSVRCVAANVEVSPLATDPDSSRLLTEFRRIYGDDVVDVGDVG
ncbi:MAG TPA: DNA polymerase III subunit gamma/tau [Candidatus Limnocylindrales bacterium]|nr:DNA polymerase III subunit gamma/tau [Candidatus Limnocylindrales bacterium]